MSRDLTKLENWVTLPRNLVITILDVHNMEWLIVTDLCSC